LPADVRERALAEFPAARDKLRANRREVVG
jgi:hypothetical protein